MTVRFLEVAEIELDHAVRWYESQAPGLGKAFVIEVLSAAERVALYPEAWALPRRGASPLPPQPLSYGLIYAVENGDILVLAVAHLHGKPRY